MLFILIELFLLFTTLQQWLWSVDGKAYSSSPLHCTKVGTNDEGWYTEDGQLVMYDRCLGETISVCRYPDTKKEGWYIPHTNFLLAKATCSTGSDSVVSCTSNADCETNQFCYQLPGSTNDHCNAIGNCTSIPKACTKDLRPVCGCDGRNYSNPCVAASFGVSVETMDWCAPPSLQGCSTNDDCNGKGYYCSKDEGNCASQSGTCVATPQMCTMQYEPVCGCDSQDYSSPCMAAGARTNVDFHGKCESQPPPPPSGGYDTGCTTDSECQTGEFCRMKDGACDTGSGSCTEVPQACTMEWNPVCGCDGRTYATACSAFANSVNIKWRDTC